ncbi:zf-HC2 domain-containing protein [Streptosporangium sp. NPDC001559]|uniref:zf-HC2 domain-containing protein n=1 Tax=Streptosporangium sp. NPDC001559 TaxID=3366187 RepID=UPI0036ECAC38
MRRASLGCREAGGLVTAYLEEALPAGTRRRFEEHLAGCSLCPDLLERVRVTVEVLRAFGGEDIPQEVLTRLCDVFGPPEGPSQGLSRGSSRGLPQGPRGRLSPVPPSGAPRLLDPGVPPVAEGGQ